MGKPYHWISLALAIVGALTIPGSVAYSHSLDDVETERVHIEERARSELGTRYNYGGASPQTGFDCSGFTRWVFGGHGAEPPHRSVDQFDMAGHNGAVRIRKGSNLERGDLVFFKTTSARVGHAGIYLSKGSFIHSSSAGGAVRISSMSDGYYRETFVGGTRLKVTRI